MNDETDCDVRAEIFEIPVKPVSVNSAYTSPKGRKGRVLTNEARQKKKDIAWRAKSSMDGSTPISGPLYLEIQFFFYRKSREENLDGIAHPDVTNYDKLLLDALKGTLWNDDKQIVEYRALKFPVEEKSDECVYIHCAEIVNEDFYK